MYISPKITVIKEIDEPESFFCSICNFCLTTEKDHELHSKYGSCEECYYNFVEAIVLNWNKDKKQINKNKLNEYIYLRKKLSTKKFKID